MTLKKTILAIFLLQAILFSQESLLFKPLTANGEPRIGSFYQFQMKVRLDIGTSLDLFDFNIEQNSFPLEQIYLYTIKKRRYFKFPVEDFFFGANLNWLSDGDCPDVCVLTYPLIFLMAMQSSIFLNLLTFSYLSLLI